MFDNDDDYALWSFSEAEQLLTVLSEDLPSFDEVVDELLADQTSFDQRELLDRYGLLDELHALITRRLIATLKLQTN